MRFNEFGESNHPTVLLLCNNEFTNKNDMDLVDYLKNHYNVIMPDWKSENEELKGDAELISDFVKQYYHGKVHAICCTSDAWGIMKQILLKSRINSEFAVIESEDILPGQLIISSLEEFDYLKGGKAS